MSDNRYSVNSSTISGDDFQVANADNKHNEHLNYDKFSPPTPIEGCNIDYRTASMSHKDHQNQMATVLQDYTDDSMAKQSEDNDGMPPVAVSVDTGVYSTSCFGDSPIPPPDGGYTSCSIPLIKLLHTIPQGLLHLPLCIIVTSQCLLESMLITAYSSTATQSNIV